MEATPDNCFGFLPLPHPRPPNRSLIDHPNPRLHSKKRPGWDCRLGSAVSRGGHAVSYSPWLTQPRLGLSRNTTAVAEGIVLSALPSAAMGASGRGVPPGDVARRCKGPREANGVDGG